MKVLQKSILVFLCLCIGLPIHAQDFVMTFVFTDANGNRDTVYTGAAEDATYFYDAQYDGPDISDIPINDSLDVRISFVNQTSGLAYESKRNIIPYSDANGAIVPLDVTAGNWPIEVSWSTVGETDDPRIAHSIITAIDFGFWYDSSDDTTALGFTPLNLGFGKPGVGSATMRRTSNIMITSTGDTIYRYWIGFIKDNPNSTTPEVATPDQLTIYPNPATGSFLQLEGTLLGSGRALDLFDAQGRHLRHYARIPQQLPLGELPPGWYVLRLQDRNGRYWTKQLLRQ
ncbi:T9SS type A sorting domain-containing protein [Neolewinella lacunae]|uniref:T9SS type A sorting domain-containing protein n=1 Tax=Neolewinella lacunae TaxID=1517758 RepID=A0A923PLQ6_9BACT|nr:T9SS type A sorting domain-containing protein [Neolewinella lacunae]MBC6993604.1 T9SS type A sorting domain-containing protein [Neolewinella lacunae]MDN3633464.1 T9SS type A sorting domain-containing protein [Neolewinella lacunae]